MDCGGGEGVSRISRGKESGGDDGMEEEKGKVFSWNTTSREKKTTIVLRSYNLYALKPS